MLTIDRHDITEYSFVADARLIHPPQWHFSPHVERAQKRREKGDGQGKKEKEYPKETGGVTV